jgi:hypothetical protein
VLPPLNTVLAGNSNPELPTMELPHMFISDDADELVARKYTITLPQSLWTQLDNLVALSDSGGRKINVEKSLAKVLADEIRRAAKRGRRLPKEESEQLQ